MPPVLIDLETEQEEEDLIDLEEAAAADRQPNYWGSAIEGIGDVVRAPINMATSAYGFASDALSKHPTQDPLTALLYESGKYGYENPQVAAPTIGAGLAAATGATFGPLVGAGAAPMYMDAANRFNEWAGVANPQDEATRAEQFTRNLTGGLAGIGAAKTLGAVTKGGTGLVNRFDKGRAKYTADWEEANYPGSSAAPFNVPRGSTAAENQLASDVLRYEDTFYDLAPMKGVERAPGKTPGAEMLKNLLPQGEEAMRIKNALLAELDTKGPGISMDDLDLSSFGRTVDKTRSSAFASPVATDEVLGTLRESFNRPANYAPGLATNNIRPSNVQTILTTIDDELRQLGAWDKQTKAGGVLTPSQAAKIEKMPELLKTREALRSALEQYSDTYSGAPGAMQRLNDVYATTRTYEDLITRHMPEPIQGMTREFAGGRQMTSPATPSSAWNSPTATLLNEATGGYAKDLAMAKGRIENIDNAWETPARLNRFAELRNQPYAPQPGRGFGSFNAASEGFQGIMDALAPVLPAMMSLDPMTGQIHDPNERRVGITAIQNSANVSLVQQAQAISQLNGGKLPQGIEQVQQTQQLPDIGSAYGAAERAMGGEIDLEDYTEVPGSEDDLAMRMMDEVDYDRSGY